MYKIGGFCKLFGFTTTAALLPSVGVHVLFLPCAVSTLPSNLFLLQPQLLYHLFKLVLLCFQHLVQTLEFLDRKRRRGMYSADMHKIRKGFPVTNACDF